MHKLWCVPWVLPVSMVAWNIFYTVMTFMVEGRVRITTIKFAVLYAGTVKPAMEGDLTPFITVFSMPG